MKAEQSSLLFTLYVSAFLASLTQSTSGTFTQVFAKDMGGSYFDLGLIGFASQITGVIASLSVGTLSIRFYSNKLLTLGVVLNALGVGLNSIAHSPYDLILFSLISGTGIGIFFPFVDAAVSEQTNPSNRNKSFGRYVASWGSALLVGPIIGGTVGTLVGIREVFLASALIGGVSIAVVVLRLQPNMRDRKEDVSEPKTELTQERRFRIYPIVAITLLNAFIIGILFSIFPGYAQSLSLPVYQIGLFSSIYAGVRMFYLFSPGKVASLGISRALLISMLLLSLPTLILAYAKDFVSFALCFALFGSSAGIFLPTIMIMFSRARSKRGITAAMGVFESMSGAGSMIGPVVGGYVATSVSPTAPYFLCCGIGLASIPIILLNNEYTKVAEPGTTTPIVESAD
jgi:MFS family permease